MWVSFWFVVVRSREDSATTNLERITTITHVQKVVFFSLYFLKLNSKF